MCGLIISVHPERKRREEKVIETKIREHGTREGCMSCKEDPKKSMQDECGDQRFQTNSHVRFREPL